MLVDRDAMYIYNIQLTKKGKSSRLYRIFKHDFATTVMTNEIKTCRFRSVSKDRLSSMQILHGFDFVAIMQTSLFTQRVRRDLLLRHLEG